MIVTLFNSRVGAVLPSLPTVTTMAVPCFASGLPDVESSAPGEGEGDWVGFATAFESILMFSITTLGFGIEVGAGSSDCDGSEDGDGDGSDDGDLDGPGCAAN